MAGIVLDYEYANGEGTSHFFHIIAEHPRRHFYRWFDGTPEEARLKAYLWGRRLGSRVNVPTFAGTAPFHIHAEKD